MTSSFRITVLPGDGIGPQVMAPTLDLLRAAGTRAVAAAVGAAMAALDPAEAA